jgi:EAL domain-containing protein (putative c-di-GMP-specific phosphodiesterase class I)
MSSCGYDVPPTTTPESLLRDADIAMYRAKDHGGDRYELFDSALRAGVRIRLETETDLRRALERDELLLHYQPTIDLLNGSVIGVEALVRWAHPERGLLPPDEFIPVAEETGLIVPLGAAVLDMACREVGTWQRESPALRSLVVGVNLSTRQLLDRGLIDLIHRRLDETGLDPACLCFEITESVVLGDVDRAAAALHALKRIGVTIGLDDFGTGYSSLSYLQRLPIDVLKIDRSFVAGLTTSRADHALVTSIIEMSHALGIRTIAEGVETEDQLRALTVLGCDHAQGYLWSRPLPAPHARAGDRRRGCPAALISRRSSCGAGPAARAPDRGRATRRGGRARAGRRGPRRRPPRRRAPARCRARPR